jgi:UDP-N-acetylglucosamine 1-carboxyvinyltransferase
MNEIFEIEGGKKISGEIAVMGTKNGALAILSACLLTKEPCVIKNIPLVTDVLTMIEIIKSLGAEVEWLEEKTVKIQAKDLKLEPESSLAKKIRASVLIAGPMLARMKEIKIAKPGGCRIGVRGLDAHLEGFGDVGIVAEQEEKEKYYLKSLQNINNSIVVLKEFSVTATENLMMLFAGQEGTNEIHLSATEPHIVELGEFLKKMGVEIDGLGTHSIKVKGSKNLKGVEHCIWPDYIEAGTFMALAASTKSDLTIKNTPVEYMEMIFRKLKEFGISYKMDKESVLIEGSASHLMGTKIQTMPYPGFPTDLQSPFAVIGTQAQGNTLVFDTLFEGRFRYVDELNQMGAKITICDPHRVLIAGPTPLYGAKIKTCDLRAGATMIIAALVAEGKSQLVGANEIDRGYEKIEERLQKIGAEIKRVQIEN